MSFLSGALVNILTTGITKNGSIMAIVEAIGEFAGPRIKNKAIEEINPVSIPAVIPALVARFQYKPYKYGAIKVPATAPHDKDIKVTINQIGRASCRERV